MILDEHKILFLIVGGVLILLVASPFLSRILVLPRTEFFSELWILGPNHMAKDYPYNIIRNNDYCVYLEIGNRLGYCAYYLIEVKLRNITQPTPVSWGSVSSRVPSSLPSLYNISAFVADDEVQELPLSFSFDYTYNKTDSTIEFSSLKLNDVSLDICDYNVTWDSEGREFRSNLLFELWIYNRTASDFQYHGRFVTLHLNMTGS